MLGALIGGISSGVGSTLNAASSIYGTSVSKDISQSNLNLQRENLEYQKWLNSEQWKRDDNAVQRRVSDLKEAGLSPVLAAGQAASSSSPISTSAPQRDSSFTKGYSDIGNKISAGVNDGISTAMNVASSMATIEKQMADISKTRAEEDNIALQNKRAAIGLSLDTQMLPHQLRLAAANAAYKEGQINLNELQRIVQEYNLDQSRKLGQRTTDTSTPWSIGSGLYRNLRDEMPEIANGLNSLFQFGGKVIDDIVTGASKGPNVNWAPFMNNARNIPRHKGK